MVPCRRRQYYYSLETGNIRYLRRHTRRHCIFKPTYLGYISSSKGTFATAKIMYVNGDLYKVLSRVSWISDQGIHRCSISFKVTKRLKSEYNFTPRYLNQILNL